MRKDQESNRNVMRARRRESSDSRDTGLPAQWQEVLRSYKAGSDERQEDAAYPRRKRLFDIVREDGHIRLMLGYDRENPVPNFADPGQRRQVEAILEFENALDNMMAEAESRWKAGDFEGEAAILEEFADRNPQREAILDLVAEARRDALSGASTRSKPKRRQEELDQSP